jgi:hypothetical protein
VTNANIVIKQDVKDTSYEDARGNIVKQSEITITYDADILPVDRPISTGRIYPKHVVEQAIAEYQKRIQSNTACGSMDPSSEPVVPLNEVSHVVTALELRNDGVHAQIKTLRHLRERSSQG